jgi:predicted nucleic-acid-binding protein
VTGLDTNVLVRYIVRDEPAQAARAARQLEQDERFLVGSIVLCELAWVTADFADCLIGRRNRAAGAAETVTFDRSLRGLEGIRLL